MKKVEKQRYLAEVAAEDAENALGVLEKGIITKREVVERIEEGKEKDVFPDSDVLGGHAVAVVPGLAGDTHA